VRTIHVKSGFARRPSNPVTLTITPYLWV